MKNKTTEHNPGASETTRFFCTRISSAAGAADELKQHRKEPNMANKNTNPVGGKTAVPADINNAQPTYSSKPHQPGRSNVPVARNSIPKPHKTPKIKPFSLLISHYPSLITHIPKYRNQIPTLLGVPPLNFTPEFPVANLKSRQIGVNPEYGGGLGRDAQHRTDRKLEV